MARLVVELLIPYRAVAQPRERFRQVPLANGTKVVQSYTPLSHPVHLWKMRVVDAWRRSERREPLTGALYVAIDIKFQRPKGDGWDTQHGTGDCDNLAKPILDALNKRLWVDDCQIAVLVVSKRRCKAAEDERTRVIVQQLPDSLLFAPDEVDEWLDDCVSRR